MEIPTTRYAKTTDGVHIAYQVVGDGPLDLVMVMGWTTNLEAQWEEPSIARFYSRLAGQARLILFDKRGVGLSDRVPDHLPALETRMDDARAVMDAAGSERAVLMGVSEGGPMAIMFAATYPGRTIGLVLYGTRSDFREEDPQQLQATLDEYERGWGTEALSRDALSWAAPGHEHDERLVRWLASYLRRAASPGAAIDLERMNSEIDVTPALDAIHVPTLVIGRIGDLGFPIEDVRRLASRIQGARLIEAAGDAHFFFVGDQENLLAPIDSFLGELRGQESVFDRVLATVLFTDIVGSTEKSARLGDHAWGELVERHHSTVRALLARFRGNEVDTAGDGFFATFDGPARAVMCASAIVEALHPLGLEVRAGVHTGEVQTADGKTSGMAVVIGARVGALAGHSEVLVSQTVKDLVAGSGLTFEDAGEHELKGVPDRWYLYRVVK